MNALRRLGLGWTPVTGGVALALGALYLAELAAWHGGGPHSPGRAAIQALWLTPGALSGLELWRLASYGLLHDPADPLHLLVNLFVLLSFGPPLEGRWGGRGLLRFLAWAAVGAGAVGALAGWLAPPWFGQPAVGFSGALAALLAAFARAWPEARIQVAFVVPISARQLVWALAAIDAILFLTGADVAVAVHGGGYLMGWLLVTGRWRPARWRWPRGPRRRGRPSLRVMEGGRWPS